MLFYVLFVHTFKQLIFLFIHLLFMFNFYSEFIKVGLGLQLKLIWQQYVPMGVHV